MPAAERPSRANRMLKLRLTDGQQWVSAIEHRRVPNLADAPEAGAKLLVGCVAVRWNIETSEGVLVDLFKAKKGQRIGCDLSSADNPRVKWGALMLRVVDDVATLLRCEHVFLADESSVRLDVWDPRTRQRASRQVMLKYLKPLLDGVGYYEQFGYYTLPKALYYGFNRRPTVPDNDRTSHQP